MQQLNLVLPGGEGPHPLFIWIGGGAWSYGDRNQEMDLAALLGLDKRYLRQHGLDPAIFRGMIPVSGTYDLVDYHRVFADGNRPELATLHVEAAFGDAKEDLIQASPIAYLKNLSVPMLLMSDNNLYNSKQNNHSPTLQTILQNGKRW